MTTKPNRTTADKIAIFRRFFSGLPNVYGTCDPATGRIRQVKQKVKDAVFLAHLTGRQPYGVYLLVGDRTRAAVVDFDVPDLQPVMDVVAALRHYAMPAYIERSKSKGHHVWIFFPETGVVAAKARAVLKHILAETGHANVELFPKQDVVDTRVAYGNFIFAPLNGRLVPRGRTVFVQSDDPTKPATNQWDFIEQAERVPESRLDEIISLNNLTVGARPPTAPRTNGDVARSTFRLPVCAQRILDQGVPDNQRVTCFRLAVHLKRVGLPHDLAVNLLRSWAAKNKPIGGKRIITDDEIRSQVADAYNKDYRGCGCETEAMARYCDRACRVSNGNTSRTEHSR